MLETHLDNLRSKAKSTGLTIGDAVNLAILEEMQADPRTVIHAEDLQVRGRGARHRLKFSFKFIVSILNK